ncbi:transposase [Rossellomorea sp. KS-H15a]|uniref:transposase n=1 Tax=Rossellomorea sp. KS-H15a TaxID=2963940 RepID=UPI0020C7213F|nr:transposase [Rossellomorea sp. KS-H15a]UTE77492.1 transposase [Rossellomorea sp. KS-H15a]
MARKLRIWYPGAMYHVTARGNKRGDLFYDKCDYLTYLHILEDPFVLHSYCLMTNHIHLQIETIDHHIQYIMKTLHCRYAVYLNRRMRTVGNQFQGRYGDELIESSDYSLEVSRYIHRNPLEANMVSRCEDYPWSSYSSYIKSSHNPHVDPSKTYSFFLEPVHISYQSYVEHKLEKRGESL